MSRNAIMAALACAALPLVSGCTTVTPLSADQCKGMTSMPKLVVQFNCGDCKVEPAWVDAITQGYDQAILSCNGTKTAQEATLTLTKVNHVSMALKMVIGPFGAALSNQIHGVLQYQSKQSNIQKSNRLPFQTIDQLAGQVGQEASQLLKAPSTNTQ